MTIGPAFVGKFRSFSDVLDMGSYEPLPNDWLIGITDVVGSTAAIAAGRYRDVNYAGASVIAALINALDSYEIPFAFRGDGAAFTVPPDDRMIATSVLQQVATFVDDCLGLKLRTGLLSVGIARACGTDVKIRTFSPSGAASYFMFAGGGLNWADEEVRQGRYLVKPSFEAPAPDLSGLACEWAPIPSRRGNILSLLIEPTDHTRPGAFTSIARRVLSILEVEATATQPTAFGQGTLPGVGGFVGIRNWRDVVVNTDYRKYDDVLRVTIDCTSEQIEAAEEILVWARESCQLRFGLHRQSHALMTCFVPSGRPGFHRHFLDGMDGGYAKAAVMLEASECRTLIPAE